MIKLNFLVLGEALICHLDLQENVGSFIGVPPRVRPCDRITVKKNLNNIHPALMTARIKLDYSQIQDSM